MASDSLLRLGVLLREGRRVYKVLDVGERVVRYMDCYPPGLAIERASSRLGFEVAIACGDMVRHSKDKGGT